MAARVCASQLRLRTVLPTKLVRHASRPIAPSPKNSKESLQALSQLRGEVAFVTGAATGIGKATAELFIEAGARVHAFDLAPCTLPGAANTTQVDVSDVSAMTAALRDAIQREGGRVDHLICSAGVWTYGDLDQTTEEDFDRVVGVNVKGTFFSMAAVIPAMKAAQSGSIIVIGSDQTFVGKPSQNLYGQRTHAMRRSEVARRWLRAPSRAYPAFLIPLPLRMPWLQVRAHEGGDRPARQVDCSSVRACRCPSQCSVPWHNRHAAHARRRQEDRGPQRCGACEAHAQDGSARRAPSRYAAPARSAGPPTWPLTADRVLSASNCPTVRWAQARPTRRQRASSRG